MKTIYLLLLVFLFHVPLVGQVRLLTIGDSTMADYDEDINSGEKEQRGWAQMLPLFLHNSVKLDNAAKNGRSSKSFYFEYWKDLRETLQQGDYVVIQFGHNDEKNDGADTDESNPKERGTAPWSQYQKYLRKYINECRQKGAIPILATPVVRRMFDGEHLAPKGRHSLNEHCEGNDSILNYPMAMKAVASEMNVSLVDMTQLTQDLVEKYGSDKSAEIIYVNTDKTHLKAMGGILFSELFVKDLISKNILTDYFKTPSSIALSPIGYDYGNQPIGYSTTKAVSLLGVNTDPSIEEIELSVDNPFQISTSSKGDYTNKLVISNKKGHFTKHIYIRFAPKTIADYNQKLVVKTKGKEIANVSLKGRSIEIGENEIQLFSWNPSKTVKFEIHKAIEIGTISLERLILSKHKNVNLIAPPNNIWEGQEIDLNSHRYIEFTIKAAEKDVYIRNLSFDMASIGGDQMHFTALGSCDRWFRQQDTFAIMEKLGMNTTKNYSFTSMIKVPKNETFYIRIYPWYKSGVEVNSKYILLQNIELKGIISKQ